VQDIPLSPKHPSWSLVQFTIQNLEQFRSIPFQIIWGEKDFVFDKHFLAEWRQRLPEAVYYSYADAGHYILDDLGDEAVDLIRSFLQRHPL
jgi:haloalkane dehalogenase